MGGIAGVIGWVALLWPSVAAAGPAEAVTLEEWGGVDNPIHVSLVAWDGEAGPVRAWIARVDLADPRIEVVVTEPLEDDPLEQSHPTADSRLTTTQEFAAEHGLALAVNANFFGTVDREAGAADALGLQVSDGRVASPPRSFQRAGDPVLVFNREARARIVTLPIESPPQGAAENRVTLDPAIYDGVAGIGGSDSAPDRGGLLVDDGRNLGPMARVAPRVRHPRTGAGVSRDGRTLILAVVDGRQPDWSVGVTLPELADLLLARGVWDALNLDGGGSSTMIFEPRLMSGPTAAIADPDYRTNRFSDPQPRAVSTNVGFRLLPPATPADAPAASGGTP